MQVPSLVVLFSASIYGEIVGLISQLITLFPPSDSTASPELKSNGLKTSVYPWFSIDANLDVICLAVKLEENVADGCTLHFYVQKLDFWYVASVPLFSTKESFMFMVGLRSHFSL